jgi:hypothetical protein
MPPATLRSTATEELDLHGMFPQAWVRIHSRPHKPCAAGRVPRGERGLRRGGDPMDVRLALPRVCRAALQMRPDAAFHSVPRGELSEPFRLRLWVTAALGAGRPATGLLLLTFREGSPLIDPVKLQAFAKGRWSARALPGEGRASRMRGLHGWMRILSAEPHGDRI